MPSSFFQSLYLRAARNRWLQKLYYDAFALWDFLRGPQPELRPPRKWIAEIGGRWDLGLQMLEFFRDYANLQPTEAVLEAGMGVGRIALPLIRWQTPPGSFDGFDIVPKYVDWCRREVSPRYPHARFDHVDLYNEQYNPKGTLRGESFRFPYPDAAFDFVYLTSVFTHLRPAEARNYLAEIARVLRPGGRCLATFFLLNEESERLLSEGRGAFPLHPPGPDGERVRNPKVPEECLALPEAFVIGEAARCGLRPAKPALYGSWCDRVGEREFQDVVLLQLHSPLGERGTNDTLTPPSLRSVDPLPKGRG